MTFLNQKQPTTCFPALLSIACIFFTSIPDCSLYFGISFIFRLYHCGRVAGKIFCILAVIDLFILWLLEWLFPRKVCLEQVTLYSWLLWKENGWQLKPYSLFVVALTSSRDWDCCFRGKHKGQTDKQMPPFRYLARLRFWDGWRRRISLLFEQLGCEKALSRGPIRIVRLIRDCVLRRLIAQA